MAGPAAISLQPQADVRAIGVARGPVKRPGRRASVKEEWKTLLLSILCSGALITGGVVVGVGAINVHNQVEIAQEARAEAEARGGSATVLNYNLAAAGAGDPPTTTQVTVSTDPAEPGGGEDPPPMQVVTVADITAIVPGTYFSTWDGTGLDFRNAPQIPAAAATYTDIIECGDGYAPVAAWVEVHTAWPDYNVMYTANANIQDGKIEVALRTRQGYSRGYAYLDVIALCQKL